MAQEKADSKQGKQTLQFCIGSRLIAWGVVTTLAYPSFGHWAILVGFVAMIIASVFVYWILAPH